MSKSEIALILPSEGDGWEVWSTTKGVSKHVRSIDGAVTKSSGQPGDCVAFSTCRVATLPLLVPSADSEIYKGAAQMELENAGLLHDVDNYKGWDCLPVEVSGDKAFVSAIYLLEEELNSENDLRHYSFDFSARFYLPRHTGDCIAMWRERHSWVMAFYRNNVPFLIEPLGDDLEQLGMSVNLLLTQLDVKGISYHPDQVRLWSETDEVETLREHFRGVELKLIPEPRPAPSLPIGSIELHPSAASEWQKRVRSMMRLRVILVGLAALLLIVAVMLWWKVDKLDRRIVSLEQEISQHTPDWENNSRHFEAWDELTPLVTENWPMHMYKECVMAIPNRQPIRFTEINLHGSSVILTGKADSLNVLDVMKRKLKGSDAFEDLVWEMPQGTQEPKSRKWEFNYTADLEGAY